MQELPVIEPVASSTDRVGERIINGQRPLIRRRRCHDALSFFVQVGQVNEGEAFQRLVIRLFRELD